VAEVVSPWRRELPARNDARKRRRAVGDKAFPASERGAGRSFSRSDWFSSCGSCPSRARPLKRTPGRVDGKEAFAGCGDLAERVEHLFARGLWLPQEALGLEALLGGVPGKPCQAPSGRSRD